MERIGSVYRAQLDNGLTVVLYQNRKAPVVAIQIWVEVGSADERAGQEGMAHLHEHMLFKGTRNRGVGEIARAIEGAGGDINAWTSFDHTVYHLVLGSQRLDLGLEVLADVMANASFDATELEKEKQVVLEEIKRSRDMPGRWIGDLLFASAYRKHPYRLPILGTKKSVLGVTRQAISSFYRKHYVPNRMTLVAVGNLEPQATLKKIRRYFGGLASNKAAKPKRPSEPSQKKERIHIELDDIKEVHFSLGWHIPAAMPNAGLADAETPALDILAIVLGQGESSRLNLRLKRGLNLVNDIYTYVYSPKDPGLFLAGGSCRPDKLVKALEALSGEISAMTLEGASASEMSKARRMVESDALYQQETAEGLARRLGYYQVQMNNPTYGDTYLSRIMAATPQDLRKVAASYLRPENSTLVVLLPENQKHRPDQASLRRAIHKGWAAGVAAARSRSTAAKQEVVRVKTKNGPTFLIQEDHSNALVSIRAVYLGGVRYEDEKNNGINNFLAGLVTRGTTSRSAEDIAQEMDTIAGSVDGFSGRNTFGLRADFPSRYMDRGMALFADCLLNPTFPEKEIKRERELVLEAIRSREDNLSGLAFELFASTLFSSHPYRLPILGSRQTVIGFRRKQLKDYMARTFTPDRLVISVVGDVDSKQVLAQLRKLFSAPASATRSKPPTVPLDPRPPAARTAVKHRSRAQAHLVLGFMGTTLSSRDRFALEVLMAVLAGQGGRLFVELRDRLSLAYAVSGFSLEGIEPGYIAVYLGVDPNRVDEAVQAVKYQLQRLSENPVGKKELNRAKEFLTGNHAISLQRNSARASALALNEVYGLGHLAHLDYPQKIRSVSAQDVLRIARNYMNLKSYCLAIVRPKAP